MSVVALVGLAGAAHALTGTLTARSLEGEHVHDASLSRVTVRDSTVEDASVSRALVESSTLRHVTVTNATLVDTVVSDAFVADALVHEGRVADATLTRVTVVDAHLSRVHLSDARITSGSVTLATIDRATLQSVDLDNVSLCRVLLLDTMTFVNSGCATSPDSPDPERSDEAWPREGSFAHYDVTFGGSIGLALQRTTAFVNFTFAGGEWHVTCEGETVERNLGTGEEETTPFTGSASFRPPHAPTDVAVGDEPRIEAIEGCHKGAFMDPVVGESTQETQRNGEPVVVDAWHAHREQLGSCACGVRDSHWGRETGLVLAWDEWTTERFRNGRLIDTDAPVD